MTRRVPATREEAERDCALVTHFLALGQPVKTEGRDRRPSATRLAGDMLRIDRATFRERIGTPDAPGSHSRRFPGVAPDWSIPAARGELGTEPVLPGWELRQVKTRRDASGAFAGETVTQGPAAGAPFAVPAGQVMTKVTAAVRGDGRLERQWVRYKPGMSPADTVETIKAAFADYPARTEPAPPPRAIREDLLTLLPCADWHVGMYAWGAEAGANWDLKLAEDTIGRAVAEAVRRSPRSAECVVLGGGDLLHADNSENRTARSGNALQVDGRWPKVLMAACRLMVRTVELCLARHARVTVRVLPGNHDENSAVAVAYFLAAWFRAEPRVTVDLDPSLFWWFRWGAVMLGATHGHTVKVGEMASIMAHRRAKDWGETAHRYVHGFHLHHAAKFATEGQGVVSEIHQSPVPQDAWHFGSGFLSGRSLQTITYHQRYGEVGRARVAIIDGERAA